MIHNRLFAHPNAILISPREQKSAQAIHKRFIFSHLSDTSLLMHVTIIFLRFSPHSFSSKIKGLERRLLKQSIQFRCHTFSVQMSVLMSHIVFIPSTLLLQKRFVVTQSPSLCHTSPLFPNFFYSKIKGLALCTDLIDRFF